MLLLHAPAGIRQELRFNFACGLIGLLVLWILEYSWVGRIGFGEGMNSIASLDAYRHFYAAGPGRWDVGLTVNFSGPLLFLVISFIQYSGTKSLVRGKLTKADSDDILRRISSPKVIILGFLYLLCMLALILLVFGVQVFGSLNSFFTLKALLTLVMFGSLVGATDIGLIAGLRGARRSSLAG
jgi:hypothetical protein